MDSNELNTAIAQALAQHPDWRSPSHHLEMAQWLNDLLDEGASRVIEGVPIFLKEFAEERWMAALELPGSQTGLAGYPESDLEAVSPPTVVGGRQLVFYVQRHDSRLPLKVTVSLVPPHVPALYEPVPQTIKVDHASAWLGQQVRP